MHNNHLNETPWYEKGKYRWLWVAITKYTCTTSPVVARKGYYPECLRHLWDG
ncbi:hypothetical protein [Nostoc sp.]|uniref:hypothetical protein n=1 Tax=Nostoc sp. TaxID=1180 RepID=UPI002FF9FE07